LALLLVPGCCKGGIPGLSSSSDGGSSSSSATAAPQAAPPVKFAAPPNGIFPAGEADKLIAKGAPAVVRLLDPGAEPRSPLRYALSPGNATSDTTLEISSKAAMLSMSLPRITVTYDYAITAKQGAQWPVVATLKSTRVEGGSGPAAALTSMFRTQLKKLEGLSFSYQQDDRGQVSNMKSQLAGKSSPELAEVMRTISASQQAMSLALPEEPLGKGGKWQIITRSPDSGMDLIQEVVCTLTDRRGDNATIDMTIRQFAGSDQMVSNGKSTTIRSFTSSATQHTEGELTAIVPKTGTMKQDYSIDSGQGAVSATNKIGHARR
jgi:hypothetical protein